MRDEEDLPKPATSTEKSAAKPEGEVEEKQSGAQPEECEENKEPALA